MITDYTPFFNFTTLGRCASYLRSLAPIQNKPGLVNLASGLPGNDLMPFQNITVTLKDGIALDIGGTQLRDALQYSSSKGMHVFHQQVRDYMVRWHSPPYEKGEWDLVVTNGGQDGFTRVLAALLDPGDSLLVDEYVYPGVHAYIKPNGINLIPVPMDKKGIIPEELENILEQFKNNTYPGGYKPPKVLYVIPTGQNPVGSTLPNERRQKIYDVVCKYNIMITEDDPYWHIQMPPYGSKSENENVTSKLQSFLSIDTQHRVVRADSATKIFAPGFRIGWVTGPTPIIDKIVLHQQSTTLFASGISQTILSSLMTTWGESGFDEQVKKTQDYYTIRRNTFLDAAEKHLSHLFEWDVPEAGMFVWMKSKHIQDATKITTRLSSEHNVWMVPGQYCMARPTVCPHIRVSISVAPLDVLASVVPTIVKAIEALIEEEKTGKNV